MRIFWIAAAVFLAGNAVAYAADVFVRGGNIVLTVDGVDHILTHTGRDAEPILSPNGKSVVFTRMGSLQPASGDPVAALECAGAPNGDELREIGIDGQGEKLLVSAKGAKKAEAKLCGFSQKAFNADGNLLFFLTPAWVTSSALHVYDIRSGKQRYVLPANDVLLLTSCSGDFHDVLVVQQHRYFAFGGSYDRYWAYDPTGKSEIGLAAETDDPHEARRLARDVWCDQ